MPAYSTEYDQLNNIWLVNARDGETVAYAETKAVADTILAEFLSSKVVDAPVPLPAFKDNLLILEWGYSDEMWFMVSPDDKVLVCDAWNGMLTDGLADLIPRFLVDDAFEREVHLHFGREPQDDDEYPSHEEVFRYLIDKEMIKR